MINVAHKNKIDIDTVLHVRKPVGWSSFDLVRWFKRRCPDVKIGHAGTLDPFADGVLIVCFGKATKKAGILVNLPKEYVVTVRLGVETDTLDVTGRVTGRRAVPVLDRPMLESAAADFHGPVMQAPPSYSALKVQGQRAYKLARSGKDVQLEPRKITIYKFDVLRFNTLHVVLKVCCSKGTYIRSIAGDYARKLGTVGYAGKLTRTRIGDYSIKSAIELQNFSKHMLDQNEQV